MVYGTDTNAFANAWLFVVDNGASDEWPPPPPPMNTLTIMNDRSTTLTIFTGISGCVVKERDYPHHHHYHDNVYIEPEHVVEEKVVVR